MQAESELHSLTHSKLHTCGVLRVTDNSAIPNASLEERVLSILAGTSESECVSEDVGIEGSNDGSDSDDDEI